MSLFLNVLISVVAVFHIGFLILEMFLWTKPLGLKIFRLKPDVAASSKVLAANQGLYNGFLAAGLIWGLLHPVPEAGVQIQLFFLGCVSIAGIYGAATVNKRIFFVQALPALIALVLLTLQ
jgi:putative membrane protein